MRNLISLLFLLLLSVIHQLFSFHSMSVHFHAHFQELLKLIYVEKSSSTSSLFFNLSFVYKSFHFFFFHLSSSHGKWSKQIYIIMWKCAIKYYTQYSVLVYAAAILYGLMILYFKYFFKVWKVQEHYYAFASNFKHN